MNNEKRNKHMTLDDRIEIQECLNKGMTFKAIAQRIEKDQTTVSKEVKLHGKVHTNGFIKTDECCVARRSEFTKRQVYSLKERIHKTDHKCSKRWKNKYKKI